MIVSDMAFYATVNSGTGSRARYNQLFAKDGPAKVHLLVRLLSPALNEESQIVAALQIQRRERKVKKTSDNPLLMTEIERLNIPAGRVTTFNRFHRVFTLDRYEYLLIVTFLISSCNGDVYKEKASGKAKFWLTDVVEGEKETHKVELQPQEGAELRYREAEFSVDWSAMTECILSMELRMRVDMDEGWLFPTSRLCFIVFGWGTRSTSWTPLYRSEVLSKPTEFYNGEGEMVFGLVEASLNQIDGVLENRPLRIEIFQLVSGTPPKLLAFLGTSLKDLRQTKEKSEMDWRLNTFPHGEVMGTLTMGYSRISQNRHFFVLHAYFGGTVRSDSVYFALTLAEHGRHTLRRSLRSYKPFYCISRAKDDATWEHVYRSEAQTEMPGTGSVQFQLAKLTARDLTSIYDGGPLWISFYYERVGRNIGIGYFKTSLAALSRHSAETVFPLQRPNSSGQAHSTCADGYAVLGEAQKSDLALFVPIHCVLGQAAPGGTSDVPPAIEEMEFDIPSSASTTP